MQLNLQRLAPKKSTIVYGLIYLTVECVGLILPLLSADFLDDISSGNVQRALILGGSCLAVLAVYEILQYLLDIKEGYIMCQAWNNFCGAIKSKIEHLDWTKENISSNEIHQIMGQDYDEAKSYIFINQIEVVISILKLIAVEALILSYSRGIFIYTIFAVPVTVFVSTAANKKVTALSQTNINDVKNLKQCVEDSLKLAKEDRTRDYKQINVFEAFQKSFRLSFRRKTKKMSFVDNIVSCGILNLTILLTTLISGIEVYRGNLTLGGLYAIGILVSHLWNPCESLITIKNEYAAAKPLIKEINDFLNKQESSNSSTVINSAFLRSYVSLNMEMNEICRPLDMGFEKGKIYIINGENGVGKTTLIEAMLGYTNRYKGSITINGEKIEEGQVNNFVYVPAEPYISKFTVAGGDNLSSGQKKLMQIELALKTEKSAYIFDEPTNFLNTENKQKVLNYIAELYKEKIVIIVSHDSFISNFLEDKNLHPEIITLYKSKN